MKARKKKAEFFSKIGVLRAGKNRNRTLRYDEDCYYNALAPRVIILGMHNFKRSLVINGLIVVASVLVAATGIFLVISLIKSDLQKVSVFKDGVKKYREQVLALTILRQESVANSESFSKLRKALPQRDDLFSFRKSMELLAGEKNLKLGFSFGTETAPKDNEPGSVSFDMSLGGTLNNSISFIKQIELGSFAAELSQVNISGNGSEFSTRINGKIFFTK